MNLKNLIKLLFLFLFCTNLYSEDNNFTKKTITVKDFILLKYDIFFLKNKYRLQSGQIMRLMIDYQYVGFNLKVDESDNFFLNIKAVMNKKRYKQKRYYPKNSDCNIVRNKLFLNKYGYTFWKRKQSYAFDEDDIKEVLKNEIYRSQNLSEKELDELIDKTKINIEIIHPKMEKSINCKGKITQVILD